MRELVLCACAEPQEKEEKMIGGASRESYAAGLLHRLVVISGDAGEIERLACAVEELTIVASPDSGECGEEKPIPTSFIDRANDLLDTISTNLAEAKRRLERVEAEFTCPEPILEPPEQDNKPS